MSIIERAARQAQRRLLLNRWLTALGWSLAGAAGLFTIGIIIERLWFVFAHADAIYAATAGGLFAGALLTSFIWAVVTRDDLAASAARLDKAAGLKERISSGLYCERMGDPFAQAVVIDARRASSHVRVRGHLPIRYPQSASYAGGLMLVALLVLWLFPVVDLGGQSEARAEDKDKQDRIKREMAEVQPVLEKEVQRLKDKYPELSNELARLESMPEADLERPEDVRNRPMTELNRLKDAIKEREKSIDLGKIESFQRMARQLASMREDSPVGDLAQSLAKGDFAGAQEALESLKSQLNKAPTTEEEKEKAEELRRQLDTLSARIEKMAEANRQSERDLSKAGMNASEIKRALEHLAKSDVDAVKKMLEDKGMSQKEIDELAQKLQKNCGACEMADKLAQSLKMCGMGIAGGAGQGQKSGEQGSQSGQQGGEGSEGPSGGGGMSPEAEGAFTEAADQLSEMEALELQLNQLQAMSADLQSAKDALGGQCQGPGMAGMQGGQGQGQGGMGQQGIGEGGIAPEQETAFGHKREKADVHTLPGEIISTKYVNGEQFSGPVSEKFIEAVLSEQRDISDAIDNERIPRHYHSSLKKYFDHQVGAVKEASSADTSDPTGN